MKKKYFLNANIVDPYNSLEELGGLIVNENGKIEIAHTDPLYIALFTSWVNDWLLGGDIDYGLSSPANGDGIIGGYSWVDADISLSC